MNTYLDQTREHHNAIRRILLDEWDPLEVSNALEAQDEYDSYVPSIFGLLVHDESEERIFGYLWKIETEHMGLNGNRRRTEKVVKSLIGLRACMGMDYPEVNKPKRLAWGFWSTIGFLLLILLVAVVAETVAAIAFAIVGTVQNSHLDMGSLGTNGLLMAIATCIAAPPTIAASLLFAKLRHGYSIKDYFCFNSVGRHHYFKWLFAVLVLVLFSDSLSVLLGKPVVPEVMVDIYATAQLKTLLWFAVIIVAPLNEEIVFRGFVFKGIQNSRVGVIGAILISSLLWSALHIQYDAYGIGQVFVSGLLLGAARFKSNSIYVPITMHALMNLIAIVEVAVL